MRLLTTNQKIDKSMAGNPNYIARTVQLFPGKNVCFNNGSWKTCIKTCLVFTGNGGRFPAVNKARKKRTKLFKTNLPVFKEKLYQELTGLGKKARTSNKKLAIRLNCFSDINWSLKKYWIKGAPVYDIFPTVQFWDYSKSKYKVLHNPFENLHLTYSYNGENGKQAQQVLDQGFNVSIIDSMPNPFSGHRIVDGDLTDFRWFDKTPALVSLTFKQ